MKAKQDNGMKLQVLDYIANHPGCQQPDIETHFGFGQWSARGYIDKLLYSESIERIGFDRGSFRVPDSTMVRLSSNNSGGFGYVYANKPSVAPEFRMKKKAVPVEIDLLRHVRQTGSILPALV